MQGKRVTHNKSGKTDIRKVKETRMKDSIKTLYGKVYDALIGRHDLWQQMLNIGVVVAIAGAVISIIISIIMENSPIAIGAYIAAAVLAVICLTMSLRAKDVIYAAVLFAILANFILFPIMYFTSGGYHGGMPLWLLLSLVISWLVVRKKILYFIYGLALIFQVSCILYSSYHPEVVVQFEDEQSIAIDVIQSLVFVSLIFGFIIKYMTYAYEKKEKELDQANTELAKMNERITLQSMYTLAKTIDAKDRYTNGHSMRVAKYSRMIADRIGMPEAEAEDLYNMAMLHDIGKIGVPDQIINKNDKLTDKEYYVIKTHPVMGYEILSEMSELNNIGEGARWHHERYDGKGYPDGLKGEDIPLKARIISVADAYDAMTSNRSYRSYMPQATVKSELEKGKGTQFDPMLAGVMIDIMEEDTNYELHE